MPSHHLLLSASRDFGIIDVAMMTNDQLIDFFHQARWPTTGGSPACPSCRMPASGPDDRRRYRCKACRKYFTLTSGTALHRNKLPLIKVLMAIVVWAAAVKGMSALQIARNIRINHRSAFVLMHKIRYALLLECQGRQIGGPGKVVIVDGLYVGGRRRKSNWRRARETPQAAMLRLQKRRVVVAAREVGGRIIASVERKESGGVPFLANRILPGSVVHADEAPGWNALHAHFEMNRINHSNVYSDGNACTNLIESFFARVRKMERNTYHHVGDRYLERYIVEAAFREDYRHLSSKELVVKLLTLVLNCSPDPEFKGYFQGQPHPRRHRSPPGARR